MAVALNRVEDAVSLQHSEQFLLTNPLIGASKHLMVWKVPVQVLLYVIQPLLLAMAAAPQPLEGLLVFCILHLVRDG